MSAAEEQRPEEPAVVLCEAWPPLDKWRTLVEIRPEPEYSPGPGAPAITIRQHEDTRELLVDVYDCTGGLNVTYTNGGVNKENRDRACWFREVRTKRLDMRAVRVRFLCNGEPKNLRLKS